MALKVVWTPKALEGLQGVVNYLEKEWTTREILRLEKKLATTPSQISLNPELFPITQKLERVRKCFFDRNNYIIYRVNLEKNTIQIINFRGTKQKPLF